MAHNAVHAAASDHRRDLYDRDYYTWALEQSRALRARRVDRLDWQRLAEEVEDWAKSRRRELRNRLKVLLAHLLKWRYQSDQRTGSWRATIAVQRVEIRQVLQENPGLRSEVAAVVAQAYEVARVEVAARIAAKARLPQSCPWAFERIMREDFWPES